MGKIERVIKKHTRISKESGEKEIVATEYRVDADFVPTKTAEIAPEFIENYCVANGKIDWLIEKVQLTITDKNGKVKDYPFVNLRADFVKDFFPSILEGKKELTFKEKILAKYKK